MPKDKKKALLKKKGSDDKKDDEKLKRRNSLTDYSTTSSSSSSSSSASESSYSTNSSVENYEFEKNKGTMTKSDNDSEGNAKKDVPGPSNSNANNTIKKKKNQKERKLTKKEKKHANESKDLPNPGQNEKGSARRVIDAINSREPSGQPHVQFSFDEWGNDEPAGKMLVRGVNDAAKVALGGDQVQMPFYGVRPSGSPPKESFVNGHNHDHHPHHRHHHHHHHPHNHTHSHQYQTLFDEPQRLNMELLDGHQIGQEKYLRANTLKYYNNLEPREKLRERMGFGIGATGLKDSIPETLSLQNSQHILKKTFSELAGDSFNIENWRTQFAANLMQEGYHREPRHKELEAHMRSHVEKMVRNEEDEWRKATMQAILDGDVKQLVNRISEMDRIFSKKDLENRRLGIGMDDPRYDDLPYKERYSQCIELIANCLVTKYLEKAPELNGQAIQVVRGVSMLMYLASSHEKEEPCFKNKHKKCTMLAFLLTSMQTETRRKILLVGATNGLTALHFAAMTGWPCQIDVLLKYGSSTEVTTDSWKTPLCFAARRNCTLMARQLMWHGADLSVLRRFSYGSTVSMNGYSSRKFIDDRQTVMQDVFDSFLNQYLAECDDRVEMRVFKRHSALHTLRIAETTSDKVILRENLEVLLKSILVYIHRDSPSPARPIGLFMIPVAYTRFDTTMKAHFPHVVRVPLLKNARRIVSSFDAEEEELTNGAADSSKSYVEQAQVSELLARPPILTVGNPEAGKDIDLQPFFQNEHNGQIYAYSMPPMFTQIQSGTQASLAVHIKSGESQLFDNAFFLVQIVELCANYNVTQPEKVKAVDEYEMEAEQLAEQFRQETNVSFKNVASVSPPALKKDKKD